VTYCKSVYVLTVKGKKQGAAGDTVSYWIYDVLYDEMYSDIKIHIKIIFSYIFTIDLVTSIMNDCL